MTNYEWITISAIFLGPIAAVIATRFIDGRRERYTRKVELFRTLMRTRRLGLSEEHVAALNLVEVEFYGKRKVIEAFQKYLDHLNSPFPGTEVDMNKWGVQREHYFAALLHAIGSQTKYNFDKKDMERFAYAPEAWRRNEQLQNLNQELLNELLEGKRTLPVSPLSDSESLSEVSQIGKVGNQTMPENKTHG